jgi:hypothetical protein
MNGRMIYIAHRLKLHKFVPTPAMKAYEEKKVEFQSFLTSAVDEC